MKTPEQIAREVHAAHTMGVVPESVAEGLREWMILAVEADRAQRKQNSTGPLSDGERMEAHKEAKRRYGRGEQQVRRRVAFEDGAAWAAGLHRTGLGETSEHDRALRALDVIGELAHAKTDAAENVRRLWQIADTVLRWRTTTSTNPQGEPATKGVSGLEVPADAQSAVDLMETPEQRQTEVIVAHRIGYWWPDAERVTEDEIAEADAYLEAHIQWRIASVLAERGIRVEVIYPQGEPSDAAVLAALNAYYADYMIGPNKSLDDVRPPRTVQDMRAALRAAVAVQGGER